MEDTNPKRERGPSASLARASGWYDRHMNGVWSEVKLAGKTVEVYDPAPGTKPRFGILFLHPLGLETLRGRQAYTKILDQNNIACLCPHGRRSWWTDRVCAEFDPHVSPEKHLLENVLPYFAARWG